MKVKLDGDYVGKSTFGMSFFIEEAIGIVDCKEPLFLYDKYLGDVKSVIIKPSYVRVITSLNHVIEYYEETL